MVSPTASKVAITLTDEQIATSNPMKNVEAIFTELKKVMEPYAARLDRKKDDDKQLYVDTKHIQKDKTPLFFGAVQVKKSYVSFHLMSVYSNPELLENISENLKKRMQGKSCFNFKDVDPSLLIELAALAEASYTKYEEQGYV